MIRIKKIAALSFVAILLFATSPKQALADSCANDFGAVFVGGDPPESIQQGEINSLSFLVKADSFSSGEEYVLQYRNSKLGIPDPITLDTQTVSQGQISFTINNQEMFTASGQKTLQLVSPSGATCELWQYSVRAEGLSCGSITYSQSGFDNPGCLDTQSSVTFEFENVRKDTELFTGNLAVEAGVIGPIVNGTRSIENGSGQIDVNFQNAMTGPHTINFSVYPNVGGNYECEINIPDIISQSCSDESREEEDTSSELAEYKICDQISDATIRSSCQTCASKGAGEGQGGVWTAIGCIERDPVSITQRFIQVGIGIGGGFALLTTLAGGFVLATSQGDPQKANQAKEMITNAIIGLLFIIFSVVILQFIGVTILNIPGFGT